MTRPARRDPRIILYNEIRDAVQACGGTLNDETRTKIEELTSFVVEDPNSTITSPTQEGNNAPASRAKALGSEKAMEALKKQHDEWTKRGRRLTDTDQLQVWLGERLRVLELKMDWLSSQIATLTAREGSPVEVREGRNATRP